jgi:hypothetical protein
MERSVLVEARSIGGIATLWRPGPTEQRPDRRPTHLDVGSAMLVEGPAQPQWEEEVSIKINRFVRTLSLRCCSAW